MRFPTHTFFMLYFWVRFKYYVCCIGCSCWFCICCSVEWCTWCFPCCFSRSLDDTERFVGVCLSEAVFGIEFRIAVCVSTKDFIISFLERSFFWRKSRLSLRILQHLWAWFSNFFRAPLSELVGDSTLLFNVHSSHLKWLFIAGNSASALRNFCWVWSFTMEKCGVYGKLERGVDVPEVAWYLLLASIEKSHSVFLSGGTLCGSSLSETDSVFSSGETICWSSNVQESLWLYVNRSPCQFEIFCLPIFFALKVAW